MPRILVTNDDGIYSEGLRKLAAVLAPVGEVIIVAPDREQSAASHALTLNRPLRLLQLEENEWIVDGTPTDCVNLAVLKLMKEKRPDIVVSGINFGPNLGDDVTYSGTISAAMEGALAGIPSVALSQALRDGGHGFASAGAWAAKVLAPLLDLQMAKRTVVNINFPAVAADAVRGIRVVRQGFHDYARGSLVEGTDPRGRPYYWFGLQDVEHTLDHGTDLEAVNDGYIAVTPLQLDLTHHASLGALGERYTG